MTNPTLFPSPDDVSDLVMHTLTSPECTTKHFDTCFVLGMFMEEVLKRSPLLTYDQKVSLIGTVLQRCRNGIAELCDALSARPAEGLH